MTAAKPPAKPALPAKPAPLPAKTPAPGIKLPALPAPMASALQELVTRQKNGTLPRATWIYASAAAAFFVFAVYNLLQGHWFTAFVLFVITLTLLAFGLFFMRNPMI